jgi:hypothetical protein
MFQSFIQKIKDRVSFLNYSKRDGKGTFPVEGRIAVALTNRSSIRFSWNFWSNFHHLIPFRVEASEGRIVTSIGFAPFAVWFAVENYELAKAIAPQRQTTFGSVSEDREVQLSIHGGCVWWSVWTNLDEWRSGEPWYRRGSFDVVEFLLGKQGVEKKTVREPERVVIPMPEGIYYGRSTIEEYTYTRPRWFSDRKTMASVTMDPREDNSFKPIPVPGKGENSYDIDEDAIYSMSSTVESGATHSDAVAEVVRSVLKRRWRYGGKNWRPEVVRTADAALN